MITSWTGSDLAHITNGSWHNTTPKGAQSSIEIDHRLLGDGGLFVALAGTSHDGHEFLDDLRADQSALVTTASPTSPASQLSVQNTLQALHDMARAAMTETSARKIAITGSVGKTSTKEALAHILSCYGRCHASRGNYNNHIGAPLSMARTPDDAAMIIMEMGMNHKGEIAPLSHLFGADIAVITKIADSHIGHFETLEAIAHAKAEIFDGMSSGVAILPFDDAHFTLLRDRATQKGLSVISFGKQDGADVRLLSQTGHAKGQTLVIRNQITGHDSTINIGLRAPHHATTALIAFAVLGACDLDISLAKTAFSDLQEVEGRGNHISISLAGHEALFINDSYNAGPASMAASLAHIAQLPHAKKALILTDMLELGEMSDTAHSALCPLIAAIAPSAVILVGDAMGKLDLSGLDGTAVYYHASATEAEGALLQALAGSDLILIKGSHSSGAPHLASFLLSAAATMAPMGAQHVS